MTIQHLPVRPTPPGYLSYKAVVTGLEQSSNLVSTGWHYVAKPSLEEITHKLRMFCLLPETFIALHIEASHQSGWTLSKRPQ